MTAKQIRQLCLALLSYAIPLIVFADPCAGDNALLNIIDRPSTADSACVVPFKKMVLELGYQYKTLISPSGQQQNFPETEFRLGLPANNELSILLPNYLQQSLSPHAGFSAATLGIKHEIGYNQHWLGTVEALLTPPSGSRAFGSHGLGATVNGIVSYTVNPQLNFTLMFGVSSETQSSHDGGQRFTSVNPDLIVTYSLTQHMDIYGEVYGQSKTAPNQGSGFNVDGGLLYLVLPHFLVDIEAGQRISGHLTGFNHYVGAGMGILF